MAEMVAGPRFVSMFSFPRPWVQPLEFSLLVGARKPETHRIPTLSKGAGLDYGKDTWEGWTGHPQLLLAMLSSHPSDSAHLRLPRN